MEKKITLQLVRPTCSRNRSSGPFSWPGRQGFGDHGCARAHYRSPAQRGTHQARRCLQARGSGRGEAQSRALSTIQPQPSRPPAKLPTHGANGSALAADNNPARTSPRAASSSPVPRRARGRHKKGIGLHTLARRATAAGMALPVMAPKMLGGWFSCGCALGRQGAHTFTQSTGTLPLGRNAARQLQSTRVKHATTFRLHVLSFFSRLPLLVYQTSTVPSTERSASFSPRSSSAMRGQKEPASHERDERKFLLQKKKQRKENEDIETNIGSSSSPLPCPTRVPPTHAYGTCGVRTSAMPRGASRRS